MRTLKEDVAAYIDEDVSDEDEWETVLSRVEALVTEAWLEVVDSGDVWFDKPGLEEAVRNGMCAEWLVFANDEEKAKLKEATNLLILKRGLSDDWEPTEITGE